MCAITNPTSTIPVTAITTFLPTIVRQRASAGLVGQTCRDVPRGSGRLRSTTAAVSCCGCIVGILKDPGHGWPTAVDQARATHQRDVASRLESA